MLRFFLNSMSKAYLRSLEEKFQESTNSIRLELNRFEKAGILQSTQKGNKKLFSANTRHPLFENLQQIIRKYVGIDTIIENIISQLGLVEGIYLTGSFAKGLDSPVIDLEFVGSVGIEKMLNRKISHKIYSRGEAFEFNIDPGKNRLLVWRKS